jgi:hypothetical protein
MLKKVLQLLCSLFVPKRAVNYWGGVVSMVRGLLS